MVPLPRKARIEREEKDMRLVAVVDVLMPLDAYPAPLMFLLSDVTGTIMRQYCR